MTIDGRSTIPKLNMVLLQDRKVEFTGYILDVTLEPFWLIDFSGIFGYACVSGSPFVCDLGANKIFKKRK